MGDHVPPHFHARYGEYKGIIDINTLKMLEGDLPRRALSLILDWAELHQKELLLDWELCMKNLMPNKIEPLKQEIHNVLGRNHRKTGQLFNFKSNIH